MLNYYDGARFPEGKLPQVLMMLWIAERKQNTVTALSLCVSLTISFYHSISLQRVKEIKKMARYSFGPSLVCTIVTRSRFLCYLVPAGASLAIQ